eukprot:scaffold26444_cov127-Cylindrotheca_fusiformis.AAC.1
MARYFALFMASYAASLISTTTVLGFVMDPLPTSSSPASPIHPHCDDIQSISVLSSSSSSYNSRKTRLYAGRGGEAAEDMYAAVHRKEYEMKAVKAQHKSTTDPVRMAMSYGQESASPMKLAKALRRVYEDKDNPANPNYEELPQKESERQQKLEELGMAEMSMRKASFIVDIKRKSLSRP